MKPIYIFIILHFLLIACVISDNKEVETQEEISIPITPPKDSLQLDEAKQFGYFIYDSFQIMKVYDQFGKTQQTYLLYQQELPVTDVPHDLAIHTPIERMVLRSTKYASFVSLLEEEDKLVGFAGAQYVSDESIQEKIQAKKIVEVGNDDGSAINFEVLLSVDPQVIFTYDASLYAGNSDTQQKMKELGLPIVICNETLESSPLAQAEWIKFFGIFLGKRQEATAIFEGVKARYDSLKTLVQDISKDKKPTVFFNTWYNETWFMPNAESYVAQFARDAGAIYLYQDLAGKGSSPLAIESVYEKASEADFWFHPSDWTKMNQLVSADRRFVSFKAVKNKTIFNHTKRQRQGGGNDYFESGVAFPDKILEDWIKIFHPDKIKASQELYFYERLK